MTQTTGSELPSSPLATSSPSHKSKNRYKPRGPRKQLKVLVVNFQGLRDKTADLACCLEQHSPDIIVGTETNLNNSINSSELFPEGYSVLRRDRTFGRASRGGVLIGFKDDLIVTPRPDLETDCEITWATVQIQGSKQIFVGSFYRSHTFGSTTDYIDQLRNSLDKIDRSKGNQIWMAGDFNLPDINWDNMSLKPNASYSNLSKNFLEIVADFGFEQMVDKPTRINNILDLFLTNNPSLVERTIVAPGVSDHDGIPIITININPKVIKQSPRKVYMWNKADIDSIKAEFSEYSNELSGRDTSQCTVESLYEEFVSKTCSIMDSHIPSRMVTKKNLSPWINRKIKRMHKKKQRAYNKYRKSSSPENLDHFQDIRKSTQKETRRSYRKYINSICLDSSKKFWSFVKSLKSDTMGIPSLKKHGQYESGNKVKATILNDHFKSVLTTENDTLPQLPTSSIPPIPDLIISVDGVCKLLSDLNPHKASGPDGIPARILKVAAEEIAPALTIIFQKSLETGDIPSPWLRANITPLFKKGDRTDASNYRPVSLTSICSKVLEHIIHSHIMTHFDTHSVLTDKQHGFRNKHSCETQLIMTVNDLALSLDNKSQTDMIIMDFSKAFDSVPHNRLLCKLDHYGIRHNILIWISNFLKHREQRVVVGGESSAWTDVTSGVPQGTVLGPLLFLAFINDLPSNLSSNVRLFADDCVVYRQIINEHDHISLQEDLHILEKWQDDWQLRFNTKKCFVMRLTHNRNVKLYPYKLDGRLLESTKNHPYLGVCITDNLSWTAHINNITSSAYRSLGFIKRNLYSCSKPIKQTAYSQILKLYLGSPPKRAHK